MYASEAKKSQFWVHLDCFSKYLKYLRNFEKWFKWTKNSDFFASEAYTTLPSFWAKVGYSRIKIDHIADSLLKLQIKIRVHLISVELSQLLTLPSTIKICFGTKWVSFSLFKEDIVSLVYFDPSTLLMPKLTA